MHDVVIPSGELNEFDLPSVCIVTGETQGVVFKPVKFSWYPRWVGFLALLNLLIAIIVASAMTKRVKGTLPFTEEAWSRWKRGQLFMVFACVLAVGLFVVGFNLIISQEVGTLGILPLVLCILSPVGAWYAFLRNRGPSVKHIDKTSIRLAIPNADAAEAIARHLVSGRHDTRSDDRGDERRWAAR